MEVDAFEQLIVGDKGPVSFAECQHVEDLLGWIFGAGRGKGGDTFCNEGIRGGIQIVHRGGYFDAVFVEHILVVVEHDKFTVISDAIQVAAAHNASFGIILAGGQDAG